MRITLPVSIYTHRAISNREPSPVLSPLFYPLFYPCSTIGKRCLVGEIDCICPAFHPFISIDEPFELHTKEFANAMKNKKTHDAILKGGEVIARFVIDVFDNPRLLDSIKEEHRKYRLG